MSAEYALALRVAHAHEIIGKIRAVAAEAADELDDPADKVKPDTAALLNAHYEHLVTVAGDLLIPAAADPDSRAPGIPISVLI